MALLTPLPNVSFQFFKNHLNCKRCNSWPSGFYLSEVNFYGKYFIPLPLTIFWYPPRTSDPYYESLQSKTCSLSFQNLVTFFIDWLIHNLDHGKVLPKWEWGKSEYELVMLYINLTPFFKLNSKILFVWSCDLSLMPYIIIIRKLAVITSLYKVRLVLYHSRT